MMMKKVLPVLVLCLLAAGCTSSTELGAHFTQSKASVNSPFEGYTVREGVIRRIDLIDWGKFGETEEDDQQYTACNNDKSLRETEKCPIFSFLTFVPTDGKLMEDEWYPSGVEFFEDDSKKSLDLGCFSPEEGKGDDYVPAFIYTSSFDEKQSENDDYTIMDEATEDALIKLVDTDKKVKLKFTKTPYNVATDFKWAGCESLINKVEIVK